MITRMKNPLIQRQYETQAQARRPIHDYSDVEQKAKETTTRANLRKQATSKSRNHWVPYTSGPHAEHPVFAVT